MGALMRYINRISRCGILFRNGKLEHEGINGYQHTYILNICRNPGISQDALAKTIYVNKSNVTRQLALLENSGYISRITSEKDKRVLQVYPTQKAFDILPKVKSLLDEWEAYVTEGLSKEEKSVMVLMLQRVMVKATQKIGEDNNDTCNS
jgi:DNA-binding MarR family transcriptional regulator